MGMIIDDEDVCPKCGAYWGTNGYCSNMPGHLRDVNAPRVKAADFSTCDPKHRAKDIETGITYCLDCGSQIIKAREALL